MKASPLPEPVILELRNRWPFFSEGELKWLLSPQKEGALVHQQQEQQTGSNMGVSMDEDVCGGGGGRRRSSVVVAEEDDDSSSSSSSLSLQEGAGAHCAKVLFEDVASFFSEEEEEEEEEEELKECDADSHHQEIHMSATESSTTRYDDEEEEEEEVLLFLSSQQEAGVCSSAEKFCLGQDREKEEESLKEDEKNGDMNDGRRMEDEISLDKQENDGCSSEEEQTYEQKLVELQSSRVEEEEEEEDRVLDQETEVCEVSSVLPQSLLSNNEQQPLEEAKSEEVAVVPNNDASCAEDMKTGNQIFAFRQQQQISTPQKVDDTGVTTIQSEEFGRLGPGAWMLPDEEEDEELQTEISQHAPDVHADYSSTGSLENRCTSEDFCIASTSCFFPPPLVECGHEFDSGRELMDDDKEEQEDEEEVPENCSVKRMSFDFSDGKRIPKFFPGKTPFKLQAPPVLTGYSNLPYATDDALHV
jgi:hypothetical protein